MSEYIISDEEIQAERRQAYEAGKRNREVWTAKAYHGERIVRCCDCKHYGCYDGSTWCSRTYEQVPGGTCDYQTVEPDGFCKWGEPK